jgi:hypothetical protein
LTSVPGVVALAWFGREARRRSSGALSAGVEPDWTDFAVGFVPVVLVLVALALLLGDHREGWSGVALTAVLIAFVAMERSMVARHARRV